MKSGEQKLEGLFEGLGVGSTPLIKSEKRVPSSDSSTESLLKNLLSGVDSGPRMRDK